MVRAFLRVDSVTHQSDKGVIGWPNVRLWNGDEQVGGAEGAWLS